MTATGLWDELLVGDELAHLTTEPAREARTAPLPDGLHPALREALARRGIHELYAHQAEAYAAARAGGNLIVTTGTASGKTLAFNLPVLDTLAGDRHARALYLYPTKALAQDQARSLGELGLTGARAAIYDGDTPTSGAGRSAAGRTSCSRTRTCSTSASSQDTICGATSSTTSASSSWTRRTSTAASSARTSRMSCAGCAGSRASTAPSRSSSSRPPRSRTRRARRALTGEDATVVEDDAAPRAERTVALWNPPLLDAELGLRASALGEASRLLAALAGRGLRTICFAKSRKAAELIHRFTADRLDAETARRLAPYRAGYTPQQRREIERRLVEGDLLGVTSTDALELGIDIGDLDCAISVGFPGTVASLRQQWGRAGRRGHGLAILVASEDALDQYFMREPPALLERRVEAAILDHANPRVLDGHVAAAAFEAPVDESDAATLGAEALERAPHVPELRHTPRGWVWAGKDSPARTRPAPLDLTRRVPRRRRLDRRRARPGRAGARLLDGARGRGLPPPRPPVPRARARPASATGARRAVRR